jgi:hypothetical protein
LKRRFGKHKWALRSNKHKNKYLQNSWNKHGEENFDFMILEQGIQGDVLLEIEQEWLDLYRPFKRTEVFNILETAANCIEFSLDNKNKLKGLNSGSKNYNTDLSWSDIRRMRKMYANGYTQKKLGALFNLSRSAVGLIMQNTRWVCDEWETQKASLAKFRSARLILKRLKRSESYIKMEYLKQNWPNSMD